MFFKQSSLLNVVFHFENRREVIEIDLEKFDTSSRSSITLAFNEKEQVDRVKQMIDGQTSFNISTYLIRTLEQDNPFLCGDICVRFLGDKFHIVKNIYDEFKIGEVKDKKDRCGTIDELVDYIVSFLYHHFSLAKLSNTVLGKY